MRGFSRLLRGAVTVFVAVLAVSAFGYSTFTYQGRLVDGGLPSNGNHDFLFQLYDGATKVGPDVFINNYSVSEGLFTVSLDFGNVFNGATYDLQIYVRKDILGTNNSTTPGSFTSLSPRQRINPAPYAIGLLPGAYSVDTLSSAIWTANNLGQGHGIAAYTSSTNGYTGALYGRQGVGAFFANRSVAGVFGDANDGYGVRGASRESIGVYAQSMNSYGLFAQSDTDYGAYISSLGNTALFATTSVSASAVRGHASASSGITYGGYFSANSPDGFGVYALHSSSSGTTAAVTGISNSTSSSSNAIYGKMTATTGGTLSSAVRGEHQATGTGGIGVYGSHDGSGYGVYGTSVGGYGVYGSSSTSYGVRGYSAESIGVYGYSGGSYGVYGYSSDSYGVYGYSSSSYGAYGYSSSGRGVYGNSNTGIGVYANCSGAGTAAPAIRANNSDAAGIGIYSTTGSTDANTVITNTGTGDLIRGFSGAGGGNLVFRVQNDGTTTVNVLTITGADLAERFEISEKAEPGMVVAIDAENPGKLCVSRSAYNHCVAGVISGANNLNAGVVLSKDTVDGHAVALSGRVWVYCDATSEEIVPGNLLTTAEKAGYAMRATDYAKAQGAIIGKAMTKLEKGKTGLVLVLVNLQ